MRSRYCAYALGLSDYILKTTHPDAAPVNLAGIVNFCNTTTFEKLEIVSFENNRVHFRAHLSQNGKPFILEEDSRFELVDGYWKYLDCKFP